MLTSKFNCSIEKIIHAAELAGEQNRDNLPELIKMLSDEDSVVRYWGATGCAILGKKAKPAARFLEKSLNDASANVRIASAEALCNFGNTDKTLAVLIREAQNKNSKVALHALNALDNIGDKAEPALTVLSVLAKNGEDKYIIRAAEYICEKAWKRESVKT